MQARMCLEEVRALSSGVEKSPAPAAAETNKPPAEPGPWNSGLSDRQTAIVRKLLEEMVDPSAFIPGIFTDPATAAKKARAGEGSDWKLLSDSEMKKLLQKALERCVPPSVLLPAPAAAKKKRAVPRKSKSAPAAAKKSAARKSKKPAARKSKKPAAAAKKKKKKK